MFDKRLMQIFEGGTMKILIYSVGVIGGQLCHALCACGNDVTVIARGSWAEMLSVGSGLLISFMFKGEKNTKRNAGKHGSILTGG